MSGEHNVSSRLDSYIEEQIAELKNWGELTTPEQEADARERLSRTLHAEQLKLADAAGEFRDAVLTELKKVSDRARNHGLREFFRRY